MYHSLECSRKFLTKSSSSEQVIRIEVGIRVFSFNDKERKKIIKIYNTMNYEYLRLMHAYLFIYFFLIRNGNFFHLCITSMRCNFAICLL